MSKQFNNIVKLEDKIQNIDICYDVVGRTSQKQILIKPNASKELEGIGIGSN